MPTSCVTFGIDLGTDCSSIFDCLFAKENIHYGLISSPMSVLVSILNFIRNSSLF